MPTQEKIDVVQDLEKQARECKGLIVTSFKGTKTTEFNEIRQKLRPLKSEYRVIKNSLTKIALRNAGMADLADKLDGPSAVILERGDALGTIKAVFEFVKTHETVKVSGGYLDGKVLDDKQLKAIAALPPKEVLVAKLLGTLQAPLVNLVSVLQAPMRDLVNVLDAIAKKTGETK
jgi:large subunit ribosomal protein L10